MLQYLTVALIESGGLVQDVFERSHRAVAHLDVGRVLYPPLILAYDEVFDDLRKVDLNLGTLVVSEAFDLLVVQCAVEQLAILGK